MAADGLAPDTTRKENAEAMETKAEKAENGAPGPAAERPVEILAPCGSMACVQAALGAGADAVYLGLEAFNMRRAASHNFTRKTLPDAAARCRDRGVKVYLTLNTIVFDGELARAADMLDFARPHVDAVIASDWGVIAACRKLGVPWHASTQMSCANAAAARFLARNGAKRIVLARECTMGEVARISESLRPLGVETEIFVHGAQCVAESGRCLLSHAAYGTSANRGECAQPCRRGYVEVREVPSGGGPAAEFSVAPHTVFSARDLCSLPFLDRVLATGAASLKIEGRARPPEYVRATVSAYREGVDAIRAGTWSPALAAALRERVARAYHRRFGDGLFHGRPGGADQFTDNDENLATCVKRGVGVVLHDYPKAGCVQILVQDRPVARGDALCVQGPSTGHVEFVVAELRRDAESPERCGRGEWFTVRRPAPVRPGDRVFALLPRG